MAKTLRSASKTEWNAADASTFEQINAGSLQRIADGVELMAKNHSHLFATRTRPFSCGSEFADWSASNCEQCIAQNGCPLEAALGLAYIGDGNIAAHAAALIGCDGIYPQPCTLRHHKKDGTKTMDEVLAAIDAALNEEAHP